MLGSIFLAIMTAMIIVNTINMGAQLDLQVVKEVMKKPVGKISYLKYKSITNMAIIYC